MKYIIILFLFTTSAYAINSDIIARKYVSAMDNLNFKDALKYHGKSDLKNLKTLQLNYVKSGTKQQIQQFINQAFKGKTLKQLQEMSSLEFNASLFTGIYTAAGKFDSSMKKSNSIILGKVLENKNIIHYLTKKEETVYQNSLILMNVVTLEKHNNKWQVRFPKEFKIQEIRLKTLIKNIKK